MLDTRKHLRFGKIGEDLVREAETSLQAEEVQLCTPLVRRRLGSNETRVGNLRLVPVELESVAFLPRMGSPSRLLDIDVLTVCMDRPAHHVMVRDIHPIFWRHCYHAHAFQLKPVQQKFTSSSVNRIPLGIERKLIVGSSPLALYNIRGVRVVFSATQGDLDADLC